MTASYSGPLINLFNPALLSAAHPTTYPLTKTHRDVVSLLLFSRSVEFRTETLTVTSLHADVNDCAEDDGLVRHCVVSNLNMFSCGDALSNSYEYNCVQFCVIK